MGTYPQQWNQHLEGIGRTGYNIVHFTPLMQRGESNSPYSIYDQFTFDRDYFPHGEKDVASLVDRMEKDYGLLALTDVVWNHTANNSAWLEDHPEAGYNLKTAPWLQSAFELDTALLTYSGDLARLRLPDLLKTKADLQTVVDGIQSHVFPSLRLWEFYAVDVRRDASRTVDAWTSGKITSPGKEVRQGGTQPGTSLNDWTLERKVAFLRENALRGNDRLGERFRRRIDPNIGAALLLAEFGEYSKDAGGRVSREEVFEAFANVLDAINVDFYKEYDGDRATILQQVSDRVRYLRLDDDGPKRGTITVDNPLIETYFTRLPLNARTRRHDPACLALANNGWVWNADAMRDNAGSESKAYLRRELIVWGDCAKLRYGQTIDDNPYLWRRMADYTRLMAKYFVGFRVDNAHSTPIAVAEFLLDQAREVRPNLYVCGELFTGSEEMDFVFVKRLGISSLIREAMQAWDTAELSRVVHLHGGRPIGSFDVDRTGALDPFTPLDRFSNGGDSSGRKLESYRRIRRTPVHALFMDCTHDNLVPAQKRDARDTLPNAALVYMCSCATGSVMGYDDIYPAHIDLVQEKRLYGLPSLDRGQIDGSGIRKVKKVLNDLHTQMGKDGYDETYIHHENEYITVQRSHPRSRKGYFLIARTAFAHRENTDKVLGPARLSGTKAEFLGCWTLDVDSSDKAKAAVLGDRTKLAGLPSRLKDSKGITLAQEGEQTVISVTKKFLPGTVTLFRTWIPSAEYDVTDLDAFVTTGAQEALEDVNLIDLNFVLYRCDPEERDTSGGKDGVYEIPNFGPLVYAGLQGWWSLLKDIIRSNDLGHPLCQNLRDGQWALDYIVNRMDRVSKDWCGGRLQKSARWLQERFNLIKKVPNHLLPRYFAMVIQTVYSAAFHRGISLMGKEIQSGQRFVQNLAMVSVQQIGITPSASLYPSETVPSLAAGLPHFASDWARCWGRDVFISLRGLCLCTGRYDEAKAHILAFASVLKHGMIPNLLSSGKAPRYNSRDSIWFFLRSIQDYTEMVPNGISILREEISRRFLPYDDTWFPFDDARAYSVTSTLEDIIQEAIQRHATGLSFREAKAGPQLDQQMKSEGFQIDINVDWETGLIIGGSRSNCGTWQDKMGESEKAGSKGVPGTPRDGAAIEITGLCYSTLVWLAQMNERGIYGYSGVKRGSSKDSHIMFAQWASTLKKNFERCYYVPLDAKQDRAYEINSALVRRRGIYKDLYRSSRETEDYQLRPNFSIAMCVAPDLFDTDKALHALTVADNVLRGPTGMATLDPADGDYRPHYNNSEDSTDFATAKGRNYHQGPEWLWPTGFFLRALLHFDLLRRKTKEERIETFQQITRRLQGCRQALNCNPWAGLTELTNKDGAYCSDSVCITIVLPPFKKN